VNYAQKNTTWATLAIQIWYMLTGQKYGRFIKVMFPIWYLNIAVWWCTLACNMANWRPWLYTPVSWPRTKSAMEAYNGCYRNSREILLLVTPINYAGDVCTLMLHWKDQDPYEWHWLTYDGPFGWHLSVWFSVSIIHSMAYCTQYVNNQVY
jgi:hypothetical protein